ncbi:MAG: hypothetical protein H6822_24530 [Planctomycetaceae bacterium]|nr:hypothetical protein [Planctomycetales bacterium]MCB9925368.1 hypothetical protein [Planctomycetaceae bacterium]
MELLIETTGNVRCVYDETLDLNSLGRADIRRGSHVEPTTDGRWTADMSPVNGPVLGPFVNRSMALEAERTWLLDHWLIEQ